jgi:hypothetical protein
MDRCLVLAERIDASLSQSSGCGQEDRLPNP